MPVTSIPLFIMGVMSMTSLALFVVIPLALLTVCLIVQKSPEATWAGKGLIAGLVAVAAYDGVRIPLVITNVWPDFIPRLGGWIVGSDGQDDAFVGYVWRLLGDGAGMGMAYFCFCGLVLSIRPAYITAHPILLSIGAGIFIWAGLVATLFLPRGTELLFPLTPLSFALSLLGHLVYGFVLGLFLRRMPACCAGQATATA